MSDLTLADFKKGDHVRLGSWAGPCLNRIVMSVGPKRVKIEPGTYRGDYVYPFELHFQPCRRCMDHPETEYPRGFDA